MSTVIANTWLNKDGTENYKCRAWVNFDGTTTPPTIRASGNVSSVTRNSTGNFTINLTSALTDSNYVVNFCSVDVSGLGYLMPCIFRGNLPTTTQFTIITTFQAGSVSQQSNPSHVLVAIFR